MSHIIQATFSFSPELRDLCESAILDFGITSYVDGPGDLVPDASEETNMFTCYIEQEESFQDLCSFLQEQLGADSTSLTITKKLIDAQNWQTAWQAYWNPTNIGKTFCICPSWLKSEDPTRPNIISIDPHMAFGTGTHETTQLCIELIEELTQENTFDNFLDIGCGTGILSIAARMRGISNATGLDLDDTIIQIATSNATINNCSNIKFETTPLAQYVQHHPAQHDLVCANIISSVLDNLWANILASRLPGAPLIISGLLIEELDSFIDKHRLEPQEKRTKGNWAALLLA